MNDARYNSHMRLMRARVALTVIQSRRADMERLPVSGESWDAILRAEHEATDLVEQLEGTHARMRRAA